jgi:KinB signaling pathway activation protein
MGIKNFFLFLLSTVLLGAVTGGLFGILGVFVHISWLYGIVEGGMLATNCLMGFWAYLMLDFTASITLPVRVWKWARILILLLVLYDMLFWRYHFATVSAGIEHISFAAYFIQGIWPLCAAVLGGYFNARYSGRESFFPTVFFLYVFSVLDWFLVLRLHANGVVNQTGIIMMICNFYIVFLYAKLLNRRASFSRPTSLQSKSAKDRHVVSTRA